MQLPKQDFKLQSSSRLAGDLVITSDGLVERIGGRTAAWLSTLLVRVCACGRSALRWQMPKSADHVQAHSVPCRYRPAFQA